MVFSLERFYCNEKIPIRIITQASFFSERLPSLISFPAICMNVLLRNRKRSELQVRSNYIHSFKVPRYANNRQYCGFNKRKTLC